jgi:DNA polymerase-3 subunit epsilon
MNVHGITNEFLLDKPRFREIADELIPFIRDAELVIHNAAFDVGFLNAEFGLAGLPQLAELTSGVVDTLRMAREMHPGRKNSLDALCDRYEIDNSQRTLHGALLDAELLAEVYLAMTRGQESLVMDLEDSAPSASLQVFNTANIRLRVQRASEAEQASHAALLEAIAKESKGRCLWLSVPEGNG